jgi:membrane fusion protein (multidrug efflux system)
MNASSSTVSPTVDFKTADRDQPAAKNRSAGPIAESGKPKRSRRRLVILFTFGLLIVAGVILWYINNAGYEVTDDATIEAHVIQVSPKVSAHVKAVHFEDNYQVKRGDLLIELDPRDFEVVLASDLASLASAKSKLTETEAQQNVAQAGLGQAKADLVSAQATADNAESDFNRNKSLFQTRVIDRREQLKQMKVGQPVSVRVDAIPGRDFAAHIESFQVGTGGRFTLLPPENATGNFVKVVQRVPVKIVFDEPPANLDRLWAGESVEPKVNVRVTPVERSRRAVPLPSAELDSKDGPATLAEQ